MTRLPSHIYDSLSALRLTLMSALLVLAFLIAATATAQTDEAQRIEPPDFTTTTIEARLKSIEDNEDLTEEQKTQAKGHLDSAVSALSAAATNIESEVRYRRELENAPETIANLRADIERTQAEMADAPEPSDEPMREEALLQLEQDLIAKESELRTLRSEMEGYDSGLQNLTARRTAAPRDLNEARTKLGEINTQLTELGEGELDAVGEARRKSLRARRYNRRTQIASLEQEIASQAKRQELVTARRNLANLKLESLTEEVQYLQGKTGQRRLNEAAAAKSNAEDAKTSYEAIEAHPLVLEIADQNVTLAEQIVELASGADEISRLTANARSRLDIVESDLIIATDLIKSGNLDRRAGAILRRLSNQLQPPQQIQAQIKATRESQVSVTQQSLIAKERLRDIPLGRLDLADVLAEARETDPELPDLSDADRSAMQTLHRSRRDLLSRIISAATIRSDETIQLESRQEELLTKSKELKDLLDEKLLWVPSVPAIDFSWPEKIVRGFFEVVSPEHLALALQVFLTQLSRLWFVVLIFAVLIGACLLWRKDIWEEILDRSKKIGRVHDDNYWHTPVVIFGCVLLALPIPLFFTMMAILLRASPSTDPLISSMAETSGYLALFFMLFLTWRAWDRDKSLFGAHFKLPETLRKAVNRNLRWFIPVVGVSTAIITLTDESRTPDVYEGLSLFAFIITSLALSFFAYRILWTKRRALGVNFGEDSAFVKYRAPITAFGVGLPILTAILAASGYYDTANFLLGRLFLSGWLFLLTYVVYGLIKRTIMVAQRQLALKQAIEKRDAAIKARKEKLEAEERGEERPPPPPVDTSEIDIKAMSRQSSQLVNTLIVIGFAAIMWVIWSSLLPALSIFNEVQIGSYAGQIADDTGVMVDADIPVTLWNLIQTIAILGLTFIAAKNLPGFLEIFILNRLGVDAGTRYAIVTILGYIIVAVGIIIGFDRLGLQWSQLKWIVTGLSVGIGFGLQKIIANFVSGLIILFERPVRIGDYVTIGDQSGTVSRIKIRATTLTDLDNLEILIPNEALISERVTNWTLSSAVTRLSVPVGIAYGSDTERARDVMLETLKSIPKVLETPPPQALFFGFGDSSLDFELRVFLKSFDERVPMRHAIHMAINKALAEEGFVIPFPQRDLNIMSQEIPLQFESKTAPKAKAKSTPKKKTTPKKS